MSVDMWDGLAQILDEFERDDAVRVVVLTGAGSKAFVSGADISQFAQQRADANAQAEYDRLTRAGRDKLAAFAKPTIARIRGFCLGGGLAIAMQMRPPHRRRRLPSSASRPPASASPTASTWCASWSPWSARPMPARCSTPARGSTRARPSASA